MQDRAADVIRRYFTGSYKANAECGGVYSTEGISLDDIIRLLAPSDEKLIYHRQTAAVIRTREKKKFARGTLGPN